jgi:hypothetical protein
MVRERSIARRLAAIQTVSRGSQLDTSLSG